MKLLTILLAAAAVACRAGPEGLTDDEVLDQAPVIHRAPGDAAAAAFPAALSAEEAQVALATARDAFLRDEFDECLAVLRDALARGVPPDHAREMEALSFDVRRRLVARTVVRIRALPDRDVLAMGESAKFDLVFVNVSPDEVRIPRVVRGSSTATFVLDVERIDLDVYGSLKSEKARRFLPLPKDLAIPAGERAAVSFGVETLDPKTRHAGFTIYRVTGEFRHSEIDAGGHPVHAAVPVEAGEVRVFPPGYEPLAEDPLGGIEKAHRLNAREHLLVAAGLVPPEREYEAVERLMRYLDGPPSPCEETVMAALAVITGLDAGGRPSAWVSWWREERKDGTLGR